MHETYGQDIVELFIEDYLNFRAKNRTKSVIYLLFYSNLPPCNRVRATGSCDVGPPSCTLLSESWSLPAAGSCYSLWWISKVAWLANLRLQIRQVLEAVPAHSLFWRLRLFATWVNAAAHRSHKTAALFPPCTLFACDGSTGVLPDLNLQTAHKHWPVLFVRSSASIRL